MSNRYRDENCRMWLCIVAGWLTAVTVLTVVTAFAFSAWRAHTEKLTERVMLLEAEK